MAMFLGTFFESTWLVVDTDMVKLGHMVRNKLSMSFCLGSCRHNRSIDTDLARDKTSLISPVSNDLARKLLSD